MKSDRRHQLKRSELADTLLHMRDYLVTHGSRIGAVAVVIVAALLVVAYLHYSRRQNIRAGWEQIFGVTFGMEDPSGVDLEAIAVNAADDKLAAMAWKLQGDILLAQWLASPQDEVERVSRIQHAYNQILEKYPDNTIAVVCAHMGLGVVAENLGQWDTAREHYEALASEARFASTPYAELARQRLERLDQWREPVVFATTQPATTQPAEQG